MKAEAGHHLRRGGTTTASLTGPLAYDAETSEPTWPAPLHVNGKRRRSCDPTMTLLSGCASTRPARRQAGAERESVAHARFSSTVAPCCRA